MASSQTPQLPKSFYRYTDIFFEWHQVLPNPAEKSALKAMLANDALVHPDHPLRVEGDDGIRLYIGTTEEGYSRLLFSMAQVEYLRYWLHEMEYTESLLPLPSTDYILTMAELRNASHNVFTTAKSLKDELKRIDKSNKRLKGTNPLLTNRRHSFERARTYWSVKTGTWLAIDIESWERDHTVLTEFGWSRIQWADDGVIRDEGHLICKKYENYRNGTWVPDNRQHFSYGKSETVSLRDFEQRIRDLVAQGSSSGPLFLAFHDHKQDIKDLITLGVNLDGHSYMLPDSVPDKGIFILDTMELFAGLEGDGGSKQAVRNLERVCRLLEIETEYMHNAGNDAHYTMAALEAMISAEPLDIQRDRRWPGQLRGGFNVQFSPWQENSDYSDTEGVTGGTYDGGDGEVASLNSDGTRPLPEVGAVPYGYDPKTGWLQYKTPNGADTTAST